MKQDLLPLSMVLATCTDFEFLPVTFPPQQGTRYTVLTLKDKTVSDNFYMTIGCYDRGRYDCYGFFTLENNMIYRIHNVSQSAYNYQSLTNLSKPIFIEWIKKEIKTGYDRACEAIKSIDCVYESFKDMPEDIRNSFAFTTDVNKVITAIQFKEYHMALSIKLTKDKYSIGPLWVCRADGVHNLDCKKLRKSMARTINGLKPVEKSTYYTWYGNVAKSIYPDFFVDIESNEAVLPKKRQKKTT